MIRSITVRNYGPFKDEQSIEIKPFTLLYGFNSSGKSTLLRTFRFIREPYCSRERLEELGFRSYFDSKEESMIQWTSPLYVSKEISNREELKYWEYQIVWARTTQVETVPDSKEQLDITIQKPGNKRKITYVPSSSIHQRIDPYISVDEAWVDAYLKNKRGLEKVLQTKQELKKIIVRIIHDHEIEIVPEKNTFKSKHAEQFVAEELSQFLKELNTSVVEFISDKYIYFRAHRGAPRPMYTPEEFNEFYGEFWESIKEYIEVENNINDETSAFSPLKVEYFSLNKAIEKSFHDLAKHKKSPTQQEENRTEKEIKDDVENVLENNNSDHTANDPNNNKIQDEPNKKTDEITNEEDVINNDEFRFDKSVLEICDIDEVIRYQHSPHIALIILRYLLNLQNFKHYDLIIEHLKGNSYLEQYKIGIKYRNEKNYKSFFPLTSVGYGISQVLPILCSIALNNHNVIVQEPESHLNSKAQKDLLDSILNLDNNKLTEQYYLLETHSEIILRLISKNIQLNKISRKKVSIIYIEQNVEESVAKLIPLNIDKYGYIINMPDMFNETLKIEEL